MLMYLQDYDERFFPDPYRIWSEMQPYIKNTQLYLCPSGNYSGACSSATCPRNIYVWNVFGATSYAINWADESYGEVNGVAGSQGFIGIGSRSLGAVNFPAETILMGDGVCPRFWGLPWLTSFNQGSSAYARHNQGANFAYVDGHVKWLNQVKGEWLDARR